MDESETEAAERRNLRCVWVTGGRALTEQEAAVEIVSEARLLLQEDLAQLGIKWDPAALPPGCPSTCIPDEKPSGDSDSSSVSYVSPHDIRADKARTTDVHRDEIKRDINTERKVVDGNEEDDTRNQDMPEPKIKQRVREVLVEGDKENTEETTNKSTIINETYLKENNKKEQLQQEGEKCKKVNPEVGETSKTRVSTTPEHPDLDHPAVERNLTQELDEIVSSLQPHIPPHPQPLPSPAPPPRFRAPISCLEQQSMSTSTEKEESLTKLTVSPLHPGRLKHSRALSKVLQSMQTNKNPKEDVGLAERSDSKTTTPAPMQEDPRVVSTPTLADVINSPQSVSPAFLPLFTPEAKRRRTDDRVVDRFSSPELYAGDKSDEEAEEQVNTEGESFGDSFDLDTQAERIIAQQTCRDTSKYQVVEMQMVREDGAVKADVRINEPEGLNIASPRFNTSLTDSQMELILDTSHHVSDFILFNKIIVNINITVLF